MYIDTNSGYYSVNFNAKRHYKWWKQLARQVRVTQIPTQTSTTKRTKTKTVAAVAAPAILATGGYVAANNTGKSTKKDNVRSNDIKKEGSPTTNRPPQEIKGTDISTKNQSPKATDKKTEILNKSSLTWVDFVDYFRDSELSKEIPEYIKDGERSIQNLRGSWILDEPRINSIKYCEKIANKILSDDILKNNPSIREHSFYIIRVYAKKDSSDGQAFIEQATEGRIKLLDAFSKNKKMQQNPLISANIGSLVGSSYSDSKADCLIKILSENTENKDPDLYDGLDTALKYAIPPDIITAIFSNELLYKDKIGYFRNSKKIDLSWLSRFLKGEPKYKQYMVQALDMYAKKDFNNIRQEKNLRECIARVKAGE